MSLYITNIEFNSDDLFVYLFLVNCCVLAFYHVFAFVLKKLHTAMIPWKKRLYLNGTFLVK